MNSEWKILEKVLEILQQEKFLGTESDVPVVDFHHPHELKEKINFDLENGSKNSKDIEDIIQKVVHYSVRTGHPNFHNQLFAGLDPFALAGSWVTEALNTSQYTYEVAPAFILIEDAVIQKCLQLTGFDNGDGIFCPGGSMSNMYGMVMARYKDNPDVKRTGMCGQKPLVYFTSQDAHYSILKGAHWLGIGTDNVIAVPTDARGCMIPNELDSAIRKAINDGKKPVFVNATAGTTVLGAFDDYNEISKICQKYGIWMHVDVIGPWLMKNRQPFEIRKILIAYNFIQIVFNVWMFYELGNAGWLTDYNYNCEPVDYSSSTKALWLATVLWWYFFSRVTEFLDTIFFVLRKRFDLVTNSHLIHHGLIPASVWWGVKFVPGGHSSFFAFFNTFVHIVMYSIYLMSAVGMKKHLPFKKYFVILQVVQFVSIMAHSFQLFYKNDCNYPIYFAYYIGIHALLFMYLLLIQLKRAYRSRQEKIKVKSH